MNSPVRYVIAAAAVLVVALVGYQFLPSNLGSGGQTSAPSATPAASLAPLLPMTDSLEAGTYRPFPDAVITVEAPAGWGTCCEDPAWVIHKDSNPILFFEDYSEITVYADPCNWQSGPSSEPRGAKAIADAIAAQEGSDLSAPERVTVAGRPAFHVQVSIPAGLDPTTCEGAEYNWWALDEGSRYAQDNEQIDDIYILDVYGRTLAFDLSRFPDTPPADVAAMEAIFESVQIP